MAETATQTQETPTAATSPPPNPTPPVQTLAGNAATALTQIGELRVAHEAAMLEDARAVLRNNRKVAADYQRAMLTNPDGSPMIVDDPVSNPGSPLAGLQDMINLGNVTLTLNSPPVAAEQPAAPVAVSPPVETTPIERKITPEPTGSTVPKALSKMAKVGWLAAALATGGTGALVTPLAVDAVKWMVTRKPAEKTVSEPAPAIDDTDTTYSIRVHPPKK